jgi:hypothetical protein
MIPRATGKNVLIFVVAALTIYSLMLSWSLPHLTNLAGGQRVFDMVPGGYDANYASQLLQALGDEGRQFYLSRQIPLDTLYPLLFAVSLILLSNWLSARLTVLESWFHLAGYLPIGSAVADYIENLLIILMIREYPTLPEGMVQSASAATLIKSGLTTAFFAVVLILLIVAAAIKTLGALPHPRR